jgi:hypothetical protein
MDPTTAIFKLPDDLHGKQIVPRLATIEVDLKFGPWNNYTGSWVDELDQHFNWHLWSENVTNTNIVIKITVGSEIDFSRADCPGISRAVRSVDTVKMHTEVDDSIPGNRNLHIKIANLGNLPSLYLPGQNVIRGMLQIESVRIQGIELINFMKVSMFDHAEDLLFGGDIDICVPITSPIYAWMVKNQSAILPGVF